MEKKKIKSKKRKIIEWALTVVLSIAFGIVLVGTIEGMVNKDKNCGQSLRYGFATFIVQTDSMKEQYPEGSAIITHKDAIEDVYKQYLDTISSGKELTIDITFLDNAHTKVTPSDSNLNNLTEETNMVMTHRLREIIKKDNQHVFVVSGTNVGGNHSKEGQYQAFYAEKCYIGTVKSSSQFLGSVLGFASSIWGLFVLLLIPACYLMIVSVLDIFKKLKDVPDTLEATTSGDSTNGVTSSNTNNTPTVDLDSLSKEERERLKQEILENMLKKKK